LIKKRKNRQISPDVEEGRKRLVSPDVGDWHGAATVSCVTVQSFHYTGAGGSKQV